MINQLARHVSKNTGKRYKRDNTTSAFSGTILYYSKKLKRASNNTRPITRLHSMTVNIYAEDPSRTITREERWEFRSSLFDGR